MRATTFSLRRAPHKVLPRGLAGQPRLTTHYKKLDRSKDSRWEGIDMDRAVDQTDILIVGGGPAGLSAAIKLKQLSAAAGKEYRVTVVEKAGTPGAHTLSATVKWFVTRFPEEARPFSMQARRSTRWWQSWITLTRRSEWASSRMRSRYL
jgi:NADPH-dependent 2,4-dienoyl-CoA reductase/sulfur reductase-like enzyme